MSGVDTAIFIEPAYGVPFAQTGLQADAIFTDPRIVVWRDLRERQNATLDFRAADGMAHRWHVKRYLSGHGQDVQREVRGIGLLRQHNIATVPLVAHGMLADGRAFLISDDLAGYAPADKLDANSLRGVLEPITQLAARLHNEGLHHQDLYLCHFFVRPGQRGDSEIRLIDAGRVQCLPGWPWRWRWIVKDLAQLVFSLQRLGMHEEAAGVLQRYCQLRPGTRLAILKGAVTWKVRRIASHDRRLRAEQPGRDVSLTAPQTPRQ